MQSAENEHTLTSERNNNFVDNLCAALSTWDEMGGVNTEKNTKIQTVCWSSSSDLDAKSLRTDTLFILECFKRTRCAVLTHYSWHTNAGLTLWQRGQT